LLEKLEKALESERMGILRNFVQEQVVKVLGLNPSEPPDERQGLFEIGLDSLMAVELSNRLRISLDRPHPQTLAIEHPTIQALTAYLAEDVSSLISEPPSRPALPETEEPQPAADKALEYLSDDEIEQVLLEELDKSGY
jgi:acyl carrier protein